MGHSGLDFVWAIVAWILCGTILAWSLCGTIVAWMLCGCCVGVKGHGGLDILWSVWCIAVRSGSVHFLCYSSWS